MCRSFATINGHFGAESSAKTFGEMRRPESSFFGSASCRFFAGIEGVLTENLNSLSDQEWIGMPGFAFIPTSCFAHVMPGIRKGMIVRQLEDLRDIHGVILFRCVKFTRFA